MSTSIPNTCASKNKRQKIINQKYTPNARDNILENTQYYQLIPRVQFSVNEEHLRRHCEQSIYNICSLYDIPVTHSVIESLKGMSAATNTSHNTLTALFFMLFNLDLTLKDQMLQAEPVPTQNKITHFAIHIRDKIIPEYMSVESTTVITLVDSCLDAWSNS